MGISLVTAPVIEPVTLADLKLQIGFAPSEDADHMRAEMTAQLLRRHIATARAECEKRSRRAFITQRWSMTLDDWPRACEDNFSQAIKLPKPPLLDIVSISYLDTAGLTQTLDSTGYQLTTTGELRIGLLLPAKYQRWPLTQRTSGCITITFDCGFGTTRESVPSEIQQAILFLAHSYYDPTAFKDIDKLVDSLLDGNMNYIA